ncbi:hypothetical protein SCG7086_AD_00060 [Chlamydiales bacterium SCGC AG-110-P3]|nr:hypothetical protein SCG7086_AD_00060 [Chlamydiales bacterium SCGC AG-110-P3]
MNTFVNRFMTTFICVTLILSWVNQVSAGIAYGYGIRHGRTVQILKLSHSPHQQDETGKFEFEEMRRVANHEMTMKPEEYSSRVSNEYYIPRIPKEQIELGREGGKDYLIDPDGTIRVWNDHTHSYHSWS